MCFLTRPSWDAPDPNTSPPALHDARYDGWPNPPIQLPWVTSSSPASKKRAERRFAFPIDTPSNCRPRDSNATHTRKQLFIFCTWLPTWKIWGARYFPPPLFYPELIYFVDIFEYRRHDVSNSCMWNGRLQKSSLQGAFETRTAARHDKENAAIKRKCLHPFIYNCQNVQLRTHLDDPAQRTKSSNPLINKDTQIGATQTQLVTTIRKILMPPASLPPRGTTHATGI